VIADSASARRQGGRAIRIGGQHRGGGPVFPPPAAAIQKRNGLAFLEQRLAQAQPRGLPCRVFLGPGAGRPAGPSQFHHGMANSVCWPIRDSQPLFLEVLDLSASGPAGPSRNDRETDKTPWDTNRCRGWEHKLGPRRTRCTDQNFALIDGQDGDHRLVQTGSPAAAHANDEAAAGRFHSPVCGPTSTREMDRDCGRAPSLGIHRAGCSGSWERRAPNLRQRKTERAAAFRPLASHLMGAVPSGVA